jgi:pre-60S factor REI1
MSNLFCSNCKIDIKGGEDIKEHYKSEFHRYNIKRQLVSLPALSIENYEKKKAQVAEVQQQQKEEVLNCKTCHKSFGNKNTYDQHINSSKHKDTVKKIASEQAKPSEIVLDDSAQQIKASKEPVVTTIQDQSVCLFCNKKTGDIDANLMHMRIDHSFFVSEIKFVTDLKGLLKYLGEKIHKGCMCIHCENRHAKDFKTGEAVQNHMMDKGHCFMKDDDYSEYIKYYDFSSTFHEYQAKIGASSAYNKDYKLKEDETYLEIESGGEDEDNEWEDEDGDDDDEESDNNENDSKTQKSTLDEENKEKGGEEEAKKQPRIHRIKVKKAVVLPSGEVKLPNGKIIGNRDYKIFYKQYLRGAIHRNHMNTIMPSASTELSLLNPNTQLMIVEKMKMIKQREKIDKINKRVLNKAQGDWMRLGMHSSDTMQKHFVQQCPL